MRIKPNARQSKLEQTSDGDWRAQVKSPPAEGKANAELVRLVAQRFGVRKAEVKIKAGKSARVKLVEIDA